MTRPRPKVLIVCNREVRDLSFLAEDLERLSAVAEWEWLRAGGRGGVWGE